MQPTIEKTIEQWCNELLDLSTRNNLINLKRGIKLVRPELENLWKRLVIENKEFEFVWKKDLVDDPASKKANGSVSLANLKQESAEETDEALKKFLDSPQLRPNHLLTNLKDDPLETRLKRLQRVSRDAKTEKGITVLYVAFGFLLWFESDNSQEEVRSPLLLVPVQLNTVNSQWKLKAQNGEFLPNQTLAQRLKKDFRLELPSTEEALGVETEALRKYFNEVSECVGKHDKRWKVLNKEVALGKFNYHKLAMWEDLNRNRERIDKHPICRFIAGVKDAQLDQPGNLPTDKELDQQTEPANTFHILDADSSQHEAIEAAKRGASLVLDGPPGTGKSQTIANIIAEFLAAKKTVLFVSEKAAAMEVVQSRLKEKELNDFCLLCHSDQVNKREVVLELKRCLDLLPGSPPDRLNADLNDLRNVRNKLNNYVRELHKIREPLRMTVYQVHGELAQLKDWRGKLNCLIPDVSKRDKRFLEDIKKTLDRLQNLEHPNCNYDHHPWRGWRGENTPEVITGHFPLLTDRLKDIQKAVKLLQQLGLAEQNLTLDRFRKILTDAQMILNSRSWWDNNERQNLIQRLEKWKKSGEDLDNLKNKLKDQKRGLKGEAFEEESAPLATRATRYRSFWSRLRPSWWFIIKPQLKTWYRHGLPSTDVLNEDLQELAKYHKLMAFWKDARASTTLLTDSKGKPSRTRTLEALRRIPNSPQESRKLQNDLQEAVKQSMKALNNEFDESWRYITNSFDPDQEVSTGITINRASLEQLQGWLKNQLQDIKAIGDWFQYKEVTEKIKQARVTGILEEVSGGKVKPVDSAKAFEARFYSLWLEDIRNQVDVLRQFKFNEHEKLIEKFQDLDRKAVETAAARIRSIQLRDRDCIRSNCNRNARVKDPRESELQSQTSILQREANKQRRHLALQELFSKIPDLLLKLKPCIMMSPLAVSTYLKSDKIHFDLVIFDEASQVRPHNAICAIYRGKQLIVAGDQQQLPPTNFFERREEETDDEDP
jgi:hypothetical protein